MLTCFFFSFGYIYIHNYIKLLLKHTFPCGFESFDNPISQVFHLDDLERPLKMRPKALGFGGGLDGPQL